MRVKWDSRVRGNDDGSEDLDGTYALDGCLAPAPPEPYAGCFSLSANIFLNLATFGATTNAQ
jgi:hypothetical protein